MSSIRKYYEIKFRKYPDVVDLLTFRQMMGGISLAGIPERLAEIQVEAWAASEGHKENIMQPDYNSIGTGIAQDKYGMYYLVQLFAGGNYSITGIDDPFLP